MIYFLRCNCANGFIKIGMARDLIPRIETLRAASPYELRVVRVLPGGRELERKLHERFAHAAHRGEWFRPTEDLLHYIFATRKHCLGLRAPAEPISEKRALERARVDHYRSGRKIQELMVGSTGIEPVTFPMSRGRSPAELRARRFAEPGRFTKTRVDGS